MLERLITGVITAIALCLTVIGMALFVSIYRGGPGVDTTITLWSPVPRLTLALAATGFATGVLMGPEKAVNLLARLWGTAEPQKPFITLGLWLLLIALWFLSYKAAISVQP